MLKLNLPIAFDDIVCLFMQNELRRVGRASADTDTVSDLKVSNSQLLALVNEKSA